ncbi:nucleotidyltransferase domain-containing protein [Kordia sp. SMS9]|uniref:nucleotidyltransferase domain-containing protein n=1 Tax=Kordia sp. SMS9 TaxID=2282170 RepID=UPI000E0D0A50|nr:nucleotidyltransferase domain-containing protein [Kordia sp. SMS9]
MKEALQTFINIWKEKEEVNGILLCGSYAVGLGKKHSDVDIRLLLNDDQELQFKGLQEINGTSFSYLGRTKEKIIKKFNTDYFNNSKIEARNFHKGQILYDQNDTIKKIKAIAAHYFKTPFLKSETSLEARKDMIHSLFSRYEYLKEADENAPFFHYNLMLFMNLAIMYYSKILKIELDFDTKLDRMLNDKAYIENYEFEEFPDKAFINLWQKTIETRRKSDLETIFQYLKKVLYDIDQKNFIMYWR